MSTKPFPALEQAARECHYEAARDINSECFEWAFERCIAKECKEARAELKAVRELRQQVRFTQDDLNGIIGWYMTGRTMQELTDALNLRLDWKAACQPKGGDAK